MNIIASQHKIYGRQISFVIQFVYTIDIVKYTRSAASKTKLIWLVYILVFFDSDLLK